MGWTDDLDTEGLVEENPFIFIIIGIIGAVAVSILYLVGIEYDPGWFEGQNLVSTIGIIFLIIFIPAIAISTLTGKSDLVKWEAIFLLISVGLVYIGNNFDFDEFISAFQSKIGEWLNTEWETQHLISVVLIIAIIIGVATAAMGKGFGIGSAVVVFVCIAALVALNMGEGGFFENTGKGIKNTIKALTGVNVEGLAKGAGIGAACAARVGVALTMTGIGAPFGLLIIAGAVIGGAAGAFL